MYDFYLTKEETKDLGFWQNRTINRINEDIINIVELNPLYGQKSFYGKAKLIETPTKKYLLSYSTLVCYWNEENATFCKLWDDYSVTTMKHINRFMCYLGSNLGGKKMVGKFKLWF